MGKRIVWTDAARDRLRAHVTIGGTVLRAAAIFNCSIAVAQIQARKLGVPFPSAYLLRRKMRTKIAAAERDLKR